MAVAAVVVEAAATAAAVVVEAAATAAAVAAATAAVVAAEVTTADNPTRPALGRELLHWARVTPADE